MFQFPQTPPSPLSFLHIIVFSHLKKNYPKKVGGGRLPLREYLVISLQIRANTVTLGGL